MSKSLVFSRYAVRVADGYFHYNNAPHSDAWYHMAIVFHGPNEGEGISIYHNAVLMKNDATKQTNTYPDSSGIVIIGKRYTDRDEHYGSVMVDELTFWERQLTLAEIQTLSVL